MDVLVSDTSVIVDLERGDFIESIFELPYRFVVPEALYEAEMKDYGGERLVAMGLIVRSLTGDQVSEAQRLRALEPRISIHDSYALALAKTEATLLLCGDAAMRRLAASEEIRCHGVLWVLDRLEDQGIVLASRLHAGLTRIAEHPRCRLPQGAMKSRLVRYLNGKDEVRETAEAWATIA